MHSARFVPDRAELRIRLNGLTDSESQAIFLGLGQFLYQLSDRRLACLGAAIIRGSAATGSGPVGAAGPATCVFCELDRAAGRSCSKDRGCTA